MKKYQNYQLKDQEIKNSFDKLKKENHQELKNNLKLSWSNWSFGLEPFEVSAGRLKKNNIEYIELKPNKFGNDIGYKSREVIKILKDNDLKVSGLSWVFSPDNILSSIRPHIRQAAIDYVKRNLEFAKEIGAEYFLVVPGEVGVASKGDPTEFYRAIESLKFLADDFMDANIKCAIEPIRKVDVSFCHSFGDVKKIFEAIDIQGFGHINGDVYHMLSEESHLGQAIVENKDMLVNLHISDTVRGPLGSGLLDLDTIIRALYTIDYNNRDCFVTFETLPPDVDTFTALYGDMDPTSLDEVVEKTVYYFKQRENYILI